MTEKPKHIFFDLDDTLTPSRSPMRDTHVPLFVKLCEQRDVVVVSGARDSQMRSQLPAARYYALTQNGNHAVAPDGSLLWRESFSDTQKAAVREFIREIHDELNLSVRDESDLVEDRGSQISYSLIGHNEHLDIKRSFDSDGSKRKSILLSHGTQLEALRNSGIEVTVGGTTCLDVFLAGRNKGFHISRLVERMGWEKDACLYFGDALQPGRNDETVMGVIPTKSVANSEETFLFIAEMLS